MNYNNLTLKESITIRNDTTFRNFTGRYLLPQTNIMSEEFQKNYNSTRWLGFGIADKLYEAYTEFDNKLFMLATNKSSLNYWLNNHEYYIYQDGELDKIMIVVDLPINNRSDFLMGNYSKLYKDNSIIAKFITIDGKQHLSSSWSVINKTEGARLAFENKVNLDFNPRPRQIISYDQEYEYPPIINREIFNS